jgi:hypothetical protein
VAFEGEGGGVMLAFIASSTSDVAIH